MEAEIDYSKIKFSPVCPMPAPFDVQKRLQELRSFLDPSSTNYQPEMHHINIKAAIKLYEEGKIDGMQQVYIKDGKLVPREEIFKGPSPSMCEGRFYQLVGKHAYGHGPFGGNSHEVSIVFSLYIFFFKIKAGEFIINSSEAATAADSPQQRDNKLKYHQIQTQRTELHVIQTRKGMTPTGGAHSQGASTERGDEPKEQTQRTAGQDRQDKGSTAKWQRMKRLLKEIADSLNGVQEVDVREKIRDKVMLAERAADAFFGQITNQTEKTLVKMVKEMDKKMDALAINAGTQKAKTWAEIAATNAARMLPPTTQRPTVRVRLQKTEGKTLPELLEAVKPAIQGAIAVRQLRSGDVEVARRQRTGP